MHPCHALVLAVLVVALRGVVIDPGGLPVAGARVRLLAPGGSTVAETDTGTAGEFAIESPVRGTYILAAESGAFERARQAVAVPSEEEVHLQLTLRTERSAITVTASRGAVEAPAEGAAMIEALERGGFLTRPTPTTGNALEGSPGILVQQTSTAQVSPFLRGLTGYQVLNLVDGIRFNNATFRSGPNQYLAFVDPSQPERIESTLGPSSSQYGSDSLGGTIQILTREPRLGTADRLEFHGEWSAFGATADASAGSSAYFSLGTKRLTWMGGASGRRLNDLRAGHGQDSRHVFRRFFGLSSEMAAELANDRQQDTAFAQWGGETKLAARLSPNQVLVVSYLGSSQDGSRNYKDLWGGLGRMQSFLEPQDLNFGYVRYEMIGLGFLESLTGTFSANAQGDGSRRQGLQWKDTIAADVTQVNAFGYSVQGATAVRKRQSIVFGGEFYDEHIASQRHLTNPINGSVAQVRPLYPDGSRYRTGALFVQDRIEFGRRVRVTVGGRWTRVGYVTRQDSYGTPAATQRFSNWTFNTALTWQAARSLSVSGLVGRGFRAPNANDLGAIGLNDLGYEIPASDAVPAGALLGSSAAESAISLGRTISKLQAERLMNYEFGLRWQQQRVQARAQVFDAELSDPIVRRTLLFPQDRVPTTLAGLSVTPIAPTPAQRAQGVVAVATAFDPRAVKAFVNDGRSRYWGAESSLRVVLNSRWSLEANYSYILGRELNPNRNVRRLPPQMGLVSLHYGRTRWWWQTTVLMAGAQTRLSGGDLDDERIGASRSRDDIAAVFQGTRVSPFIRQGVFTPTGETLIQIQERVLPGVSSNTRVPLYQSTAGWLTWNMQGGVLLGERMSLNAGAFNLLDRNYRVHGSGIDAPGFNVFMGVRVLF